jgi:hypothetical protein
MAAHEALGRQFLDRHLVDHHGWQENWLRDYDDDSGKAAINEAHEYEHGGSPTGHPVDDPLDTPGGFPVIHSHSSERIHFL